MVFNYFKMVPRAGLEPAQPKGRGILNPLCLPISPPGLNFGGASRSRTELHGFAIRCITALLTRLIRISFEIWSGKRDSNSRPRPWQGRALPTELFPRKASLFSLCFSNWLIYLFILVNHVAVRCVAFY